MTALDVFLEQLEQMMAARNDMWHETRYHNYREAEQIKLDRLDPARDRAKSALRAVIAELSRQNSPVD